MKINILIIALSLISVINENREIINISDGQSMTSDFYKSKTYLFILQVKNPDYGVLKFTFLEEDYLYYFDRVDIYEYSNDDFSNYDIWDFGDSEVYYQTGQTIVEYSQKPRYSTTNYLGFEIKFNKDEKNVKVEGRIEKDMSVYIIVFTSIFVIILITLFIVICCYFYKKKNKNNSQNTLNEHFNPNGQNQTSPQYNNNIPYTNDQYYNILYNKNQYNNNQYNNNNNPYNNNNSYNPYKTNNSNNPYNTNNSNNPYNPFNNSDMYRTNRANTLNPQKSNFNNLNKYNNNSNNN